MREIYKKRSCCVCKKIRLVLVFSKFHSECMVWVGGVFDPVLDSKGSRFRIGMDGECEPGCLES